MDENNSVNKLTTDLDSMCNIADPPIETETETNMETWKFGEECEQADTFQFVYRTFFSVSSGESNKRAELEEKTKLETTDMSSPPSPSSSLRCTNSSLISQNSRITDKFVLLKAQRLRTIFKSRQKWNQLHALRGTGHICPRFAHCQRQFTSQPKFPLVPVPVPVPTAAVPVVRGSSSEPCNLNCHVNNNNSNPGIGIGSRAEGQYESTQHDEINYKTISPFNFFG